MYTIILVRDVFNPQGPSTFSNTAPRCKIIINFRMTLIHRYVAGGNFMLGSYELEILWSSNALPVVEDAGYLSA